MSKYFEDEDKIQLSKYLERDLSDRMEKTVKYLISCLGDVSLPIGVIEAYKDYFYEIGSKYAVSTDVDTVKGLYEFYMMFPSLTKKAFGEISSTYIKDLFEEYALGSVLEKLIRAFGKSDDAFELFISYVEEKTDELQEKYKKEADRLDEYSKIYHMDGFDKFYQYISYLKRLVLDQHISVDSIIDSLADPELVKKDVKRLAELSTKYRCYMGVGYPISYLMTESFAKKEDLSKYSDIPSYYVSASDKTEEATFTTQEFIDSIKSKQVKSLIRKK